MAKRKPAAKKKPATKPKRSEQRDGDHGAVARGERLEIDIGDLRPNPWNPNQQSPFIQKKMARSLRRFGVIRELLVREVGPGLAAGEGYAPVAGYEVIDGEHRLGELRGGKVARVEVRNLGVVPDHEAKELTVVLNEIRGNPNPRKLSELLYTLEQAGLKPEYHDVAPYTEAELDALLKVREINPDETQRVIGGHAERKVLPYAFQVGPHKGELPPVLAERLEFLWDLAAERLRTSDAVPVVEAWCEAIEKEVCVQ